MIDLKESDEEYHVFISGKEIDVLDVEDGYVFAKCDLTDLQKIVASPFPENLSIEIESEDGFGTYFFNELQISCRKSRVVLNFTSRKPNKYWEGQFGLAHLLESINKQVKHFDNFEVTDIEVEDDWKVITLSHILSTENFIETAIDHAANQLKQLLKTAEIAIRGIEWKSEYETNEDSFSKEIIFPLLRRMSFSFVRYTHGSKEYGKDFTFSELTSFGNYRHYGLQAKAGNISGRVNSQIDELIGQLDDAFKMPFYEIGSNEKHYISTFIIAISGSFTENSREKIVEKIPKGVIGSVYFLDKYRIFELIERYWKTNN